ncbi:MAG: hypothetical protein ACFCBV_03740 [Phycisphaerales bacterium]
MRFHRAPNPDDKIGLMGCLQVMMLAAVVTGVGVVVVFVLAVLVH